MSQYLPIIALWVTTFLLGATISLINPRTNKSSRGTRPFFSLGIIKPIKHYGSGNEYVNIDARGLNDYTGVTISPAHKVQKQVRQPLQRCILSILASQRERQQ